MYKQGNSVMDYLNPKNTNEPKAKRVWAIIWKWTKVVLFLFLIVSMLWGCVQMYQSDYMVQQVTDMTGTRVFAPGTTFEIIIRSLGDAGGKNHMFIGNAANMQEYSYNAISSWGDAFRVTKSPFYGFFVYPLAFILMGLVRGFAGTLDPGLDHHSQVVFGVSVMFAMFITVLVLRSLVLAFSWKQQANMDKMQDMQMKQAEISAKYKAKVQQNGGKMTVAIRQQQQMEMQALYKKEGIKPMANMAMTFAPLPFLFAFYAIVRSARALKDANIGAISLIEQPWYQLTHGQPIYLVLLAIYLPLQIVSMMLPIYFQYKKQKGVPLSEAQRKSRRRNLIMQIVMLVVFIFIVASIASGVAIYWIFSSAFQIGQTVFFYYYNKRKREGTGSHEKQRRLRQQQRAIEKQQRKSGELVSAEIKQDAKDERRAEKSFSKQNWWSKVCDFFTMCWEKTVFGFKWLGQHIVAWSKVAWTYIVKWSKATWAFIVKYSKITWAWIVKYSKITWAYIVKGSKWLWEQMKKGWNWFINLFKKDKKSQPKQKTKK